MPYNLVPSTMPPVWRDRDVGDLMPAAVASTGMTDATGRALVACAKKRWDQTMGRAGGDYSRLTLDGGELKGFCFVVADEVERFLTAQGENAKTVRVTPAEGGGDHYFTVVNNGNSGNSAIIDSTWKQFGIGDASMPYCIAGTLGAIRFVLGRGTQMVEMYEAGMQVLGQWDSYTCFTD